MIPTRHMIDEINRAIIIPEEFAKWITDDPEIRRALMYSFEQQCLEVSLPRDIMNAYASLIGLWKCLKPNHTTMILTERPTETALCIRRMVEGGPSWLLPKVEAMNQRVVRFANDSVIRSAAPTTYAARGISLNTLIMVEPSNWKPIIRDELEMCIYPVISSKRNGKIIRIEEGR